MAALTEEERQSIQLGEEYRHELRKQLSARDDSFFKDKLAAPAFLVILTALVSGLVVPYILAKNEDKRRAIELKSRLLGDVVGESAAAQMALLRYNEQICDYWNAKVAAELRRAEARLSSDAAFRAAEFESISADLRREYDHRIEVDRTYGEARVRLNVMIDRLESTMELYYPACPELRQFVSTVEKDVAVAEETVNITHQDAIVAAARQAIAKLKTCTNTAECQKFADEATDAVETYREKKPQFTRWDRAAKQLAKYISANDPKLTS